MLHILREIELFHGLAEHELLLIADLCEQKTYNKDDIISLQGEKGNEMYIITEGYVEIIVNDRKEPSNQKVVANLGTGQIIGEMGLVDAGNRSATIKALEQPTHVQVIGYEQMRNLCEHNHHIGYIIMRNLAADISFKLRHANLIEG